MRPLCFGFFFAVSASLTGAAEKPLAAEKAGKVRTHSGATPIQVVKTWQDLLDQPAISVGTGTARLGIEARSAPCMSGILLYCLTEGYSVPSEWEGSNRIGPYRVEVRHENDKGARAEDACKSARQGTRDSTHSLAFFRRSIPLNCPGKFKIRVFSLKGDLVADTEVTATSEKCHPWMPLERSTNSESAGEKYDAVAFVKNRTKGIAIPRFDGMSPTLIPRDDSPTKIRRRADARLPTLLPAVANDGLAVKASRTDLVVESKASIILARPDWHFLVRWWVNDKPYIPAQLEAFEDSNGMVIMGNRMLLHLEFDPKRIAAKPGDTVDIQLLYCKNGWELIESNLAQDELSMHADEAPELLLSNRVRIAWEKRKANNE